MTDIAALVAAFRQMPRGEQDIVLCELAKHAIADRPNEPTIRLADSDGRCIAFLLATERSTTKPRPLTPEEQAEGARRLANRGDAVSAEQIITLARTAGRPAAAKP